MSIKTRVQSLTSRAKALTRRMRKKQKRLDYLESRLKKLQEEKTKIKRRQSLEASIAKEKTEILELKMEQSATLRGLRRVGKELTSPRTKKVVRRTLKEMKKVFFG